MKKFISSLPRITKIGFALYVTGWIFCIAETAYFGWHMTAHSNAERVCDRICAAVSILSAILVWFGILFGNKSYKSIKYRIKAAYNVLSNKTFLVYYKNDGEANVRAGNITIGETRALAYALNAQADEEAQQEQALNEVNDLLGNK